MSRAPLVLLLCVALLAGCAGRTVAADDQDGDGLRDDLESRPRSITVTLKNGTESRLVTSDPEDEDSDDDGLGDADEFVRGTDPRSLDTDADGLLDGMNITHGPTSAYAQALRRAGILESPPGNFLGELGMCRGFGGLKPTEWSSDRPLPDGLGDGDELTGWNVSVRGQSRVAVPDPCTMDFDQDGLTDDRERDAATDPRVADTDSDGARDGVDADPLWDLGILVEDLTSTVSARLVFTLGETSVEGNAPPPFLGIPADVPDATSDATSLLAVGALFATDDNGTRPIALFPGGNHAELRFDLARASLLAGGATWSEGDVTLEGADGAVSFSWRVTRT